MNFFYDIQIYTNKGWTTFSTHTDKAKAEAEYHKFVTGQSTYKYHHRIVRCEVISKHEGMKTFKKERLA